jgi:hypothetical protein
MLPLAGKRLREQESITHLKQLPDFLLQRILQSLFPLYDRIDMYYDMLRYLVDVDPVFERVINGMTDENVMTSFPPTIMEKMTDDILRDKIQLVRLDLEIQSEITDDGIKRLTNLVELVLGGASLITDEGIRNLRALTSLNLQEDENITNEGIQNLINLTELNLNRNEYITDAALNALPNLRVIHLENNDMITDECLKQFTGLEKLFLSSNKKITDDCIKNLVNLKKLQLINNKKITNDALKNLVNITDLNLSYSDNKNISDDGIQYMTGLVSLAILNNAQITANHLRTLTNLTKLSISSDTKNADEAIPGLIGLKILHAAGPVFKDSSINMLTNLTKLKLFFGSRASDEAIKDLTNLTNLNVADCDKITKKSIQKLFGITKLKLDMNGHINLTHLTHLTNLKNLEIDNPRHDIRLAKMYRQSLRYTFIDTSVYDIRATLPHLHFLNGNYLPMVADKKIRSQYEEARQYTKKVQKQLFDEMESGKPSLSESESSDTSDSESESESDSESDIMGSDTRDTSDTESDSESESDIMDSDVSDTSDTGSESESDNESDEKSPVEAIEIEENVQESGKIEYLPGLTLEQYNVFDEVSKRAAQFSKLSQHEYEKSDMPMHIQQSDIVMHIPLMTLIEETFINQKDRYLRNLFEINKGRGSNNKSNRSGWESIIFNSKLYDAFEPHDKVKYATLNIARAPHGVRSVGKQYGVTYLILNDNIKDRSTMTPRDSSMIGANSGVGTFKDFFHIIRSIDGATYLTNLIKRSDEINYKYVEVQIHGELRFDRDVKKIMVRDDIKAAFVPYLKKYFRVIGKKIPVGYFKKPHDIINL